MGHISEVYFVRDSKNWPQFRRRQTPTNIYKLLILKPSLNLTSEVVTIKYGTVSTKILFVIIVERKKIYQKIWKQTQSRP